jgi:polyhydroxybutyrate depolymerase
VARHRAVAVLLLVLAACGGSSHPNASGVPEPAVQHRRLDVGGLTRTYRLYVPLSLDRSKPAPLVLVLGGVGNSADSMVGATGFDRAADAGGFIVAYADGVNNTWNAGYCCLLGAPSGPDDVTFLIRVVDDVGASQKVDAARVFAVGVSAGAMMAYRLGCERADRIAGVGSVAGAMILDDCHPSQPVAVVELHGTADQLVPYDGGDTAGGATQPSPPTPAVVGRWADLDRCPAPPATQAQGPVTISTWTGCAAGTSVKLLTVAGGGHVWFGAGLGPADGAIDATQEIWTFLSAVHRSG